MSDIIMKIHEIKGINNGSIELPIENGVFALVGNNGTGKSTIMSCLAQLVSRHNLGLLKKEDYDKASYVEFTYEGKTDRWFCDRGFWKSSLHPNSIRFNGTYEGSLFYGQRFRDSKIVDDLMAQGKIMEESIVPADLYIKEALGSILHGNPNYYDTLLKVKNKQVASDLDLKNTPYFYKKGDKIISQYRMSSGECLLISLLHFIYNSIVRRSLPTDQPIIMLIDEIELALHPVAISKLLDLLNELTNEFEHLTIIITTHSPEVIRKISPKNIYKLERIQNQDNDFDIVNPCYPSYAIRDVYAHDGFDYLILVEDDLAKMIVVNTIEKMKLSNSRLLNVMPVGGWQNVLKLQMELISHNVLGVGKQVFSVLDGDIQGKITKEYRSVKKMFLPINSVEKYLLKVLIESQELQIKKRINDMFFPIESIDSIIADYMVSERKIQKERGDQYKGDSDGKHFYAVILKSLKKRNVSEEHFVAGLFSIIKENVDLNSFEKALSEMVK